MIDVQIGYQTKTISASDIFIDNGSSVQMKVTRLNDIRHFSSTSMMIPSNVIAEIESKCTRVYQNKHDGVPQRFSFKLMES